MSGAASGDSDFRVAHLWLNSAIAGAALRHRDAAWPPRRALAVDPENPLFLMTAAFAAERAGRHATALASTAARCGPTDRLSRRRTTSACCSPAKAATTRPWPSCAARSAPTRTMRSAGSTSASCSAGWGRDTCRPRKAHSRAPSRSTRALRDRERKPTIDAAHLPHRPRRLAPAAARVELRGHTATRTGEAVGLAALLLVAFGLTRALAATGSGRDLANTWLEPLANAAGRLRLPSVLRHPAVAVAATLAVLLWPLARAPSGGTAQPPPGRSASLCSSPPRCARVPWSRDARASARATGWTPGVAFGLGTAAAGLTWAPLPVLRKARSRVHWAAPVALACIALPLVAMTAWLDIPLTRALAASALVMAASLLTPVKPVDGGAIAATRGTAAGLTGLALAVLLVLGLV